MSTSCARVRVRAKCGLRLMPNGCFLSTLQFMIHAAIKHWIFMSSTVVLVLLVVASCAWFHGNGEMDGGVLLQVWCTSPLICSIHCFA
jgi:hypothetical protein